MTKEQETFLQRLNGYLIEDRTRCHSMLWGIDHFFPDPDADQVSHDLHHVLRPYLVSREETGRLATDRLTPILDRTPGPRVCDCDGGPCKCL